MTKVVAVSDLHGRRPTIPECDLLLIAGDVCPDHCHAPHYQKSWLDLEFREWLEAQPAGHRVMTWGNHDIVAQDPAHKVRRLPCHVLVDESVTIDGLKIYGMPWQRSFGTGWAFNLDSPELDEKAAAIPEDTDIIISHGPPHGYGDAAPRGFGEWERTGSLGLLYRIVQIKPKLVVFGHIHEGRGVYRLDETDECILVNASLLGPGNKPMYEPIVIEL